LRHPRRATSYGTRRNGGFEPSGSGETDRNEQSRHWRAIQASRLLAQKKAIAKNAAREERAKLWWRHLVGWIHTRRGRAARKRLRERWAAGRFARNCRSRREAVAGGIATVKTSSSAQVSVNRPPSFGSKASFPGVNPDVYEYLEAERIKYAIRLLANRIVQERIGHLPTRPVGRASNEVRRSYASFSDQAGSWTIAAAYPWKILAGGRGWRVRISLRRAHRTKL
jgi:hypothetical protein